MRVRADKREIGIILLIVLVYLGTRIYGVFGGMNEYFDYDEGTYLLIARFINHGILPYRDIFAVHPPLYYYLLAAWLRIFGDSYVVGRFLSVVLGALAVVVAYYTGKEIRNRQLGIALAFFIVLDPLMIQMNSLVFHETSIELFTLLSLYHFVRYFKEGNIKHAYLSLFWAGLGTTSKFTIIPYAVALYLVLALSMVPETRRYLERASSILLNRSQVFVVFATYIVLTVIVVGVVVAHPSDFLRTVLIVPGIHKISNAFQIVSVGLFLAIWGVITLYVTGASYVKPLMRTLMILVKNLKVELKLALALLLPKFIVEGTLGVGVSRNYISQTYLSQGGRYVPIVNPFTYTYGILGNLHASGHQDYIVFNLPPLILLAFVLIAWASWRKLNAPNYLKVLLLMSFVMYFLVFPVVPNQRFLYSFFLVFYATALYALLEVKSRRKLVAMAVVMLLLLLPLDFGIAYNYPRGKLTIAWALHTKDLRRDVGEYIAQNHLTNGTYLVTNPFNAYYLHLPIDPYYLDVFGIIYLDNASLFWKALNESDYVLLSTWAYTIALESGVFKETLGKLERISPQNYTLLFSESYGRGDVMTLFRRVNNPKNVSFDAFLGKLRIHVNNVSVGYVYPSDFPSSDDILTKIEYVHGSYTITQRWKGEIVKSTAMENGTSVLIRFQRRTNITLRLTSKGVFLRGDSRLKPGDKGTFRVYLPNVDFKVESDGVVVNVSTAEVTLECKELVISAGEN
ncbi:MAG: glycosyltransferase family 39 protein [Thermotogae bacterium]|nr:glycosyltransferase family 39 protein [Thermotogota bacterium]